jgi:hypothetical protein
VTDDIEDDDAAAAPLSFKVRRGFPFTWNSFFNLIRHAFRTFAVRAFPWIACGVMGATVEYANRCCINFGCINFGTFE